MGWVLGIEIGGTKLQLAIGTGMQPAFRALWRGRVDPARGAAGIRAQIRSALPELLGQAGIDARELQRVGIAFGGPVDSARGTVIESHQVAGWTGFPIVDWFREELGLAAVLQNDADSAALAEARFGAGQGFDPVLYLTVGSGIGGGLIVGGKIYRGSGLGAVEIGHLRPGGLPRHVPLSDSLTVEEIGSGFGMANRARRVIAEHRETREYLARQFGEADPRRTSVDPAFRESTAAGAERFEKLLALADENPERITAALVARAARQGDRLSNELLSDATAAIGWAIAQAVTLLNPARIVIGGGVSLIGEELFFAPIRRAVRQYVFPPFADVAETVPASLGEEVVLYGATALAAGN